MSKEKVIFRKKANFNWLLKMAWRDARASKGKLFLFMASMILGIAAVVAIQSFSTTLKDNIALQSKSLMGADYLIDLDKPPNEKVQSIIDSLGPKAEEISFASMVAFPNKTGTKLSQIRGIKGGFPFYGEIVTVPESAANTYQENGSALVDATVMLQLGIKPGDSIKVGDLTLKIEGSLKSVPGSSAVFSSVSPPVIIPEELIDATNLVKTGSRIEYNYYFVATPNQDMVKLDANLGWRLDALDADIDTHTSTSERMGKRYENFGRFLNLVAFIALLLGCVGIASAIHIYIKEKLRSVAVLKCIGATKQQTFIIYLLQIATMGLIGGIIGTFLGFILQQLFPYLLQDLLPIDVQIHFPVEVILMGLLLGVFMSVLFALYPLMSTLYVSPLQALRITQDTPSRSKKAGLFVLGGIFLFILLFSFWLLDNWKFSLAFVLGIIITFAILTAIAGLFMKTIKKFFPRSWGFAPRQSLLNLFRPQNQTLILVLSIGIGTFLISTLYFTKDLLLSQASIDEQSKSPNMILLDVQTAQVNDVLTTIKNQNLPILQNIPIVAMRIHSINGTLNKDLKEDSVNIRRWVLNHEFRSTYRDNLIDSETLKEGEWIPEASNEGVIPISVSDNLANDANLKLHDQVTFNVQGVLMKTRVASIRTVDWGQIQLNFTVVFPNKVLEDAPQFSVITTKAANEKASATLQQGLVEKFPNISIIDLRQVLSVIEDLLNKISWIINFMAFFSILTGIIVLIGAVRTSKYQRIKESVLLRTLGAKSSQILKILALEYLFLGFLGTLSGILLSLVSIQLLAWQLFDSPFIPSLVPFLIILPGIVVLVLFIGLTNSRSVITSPPLEVLRKSGM
ncbi:putative ABC transport system permease protein [Flavobacteriaceae bacterium MAR_2010_188]|nr:putative ABC transport system permease protein [Flavobacteriaceae bacterium MAR_2010_188]